MIGIIKGNVNKENNAGEQAGTPLRTEPHRAAQSTCLREKA